MFLVIKAKEVKIVKEVKRIDSFWRFSCGDVLCRTWFPVVVVRHRDMFRTLSEASLWRALHWRGCSWTTVPQRGGFKTSLMPKNVNKPYFRTQWPQQHQYLWLLLDPSQRWPPQSAGRPGASVPTRLGSPTSPSPLESSLPSCSSSTSSCAGNSILLSFWYLICPAHLIWYIIDARLASHIYSSISSAMTCSCTRTEVIEKEPSIYDDYSVYESQYGYAGKQGPYSESDLGSDYGEGSQTGDRGRGSEAGTLASRCLFRTNISQLVLLSSLFTKEHLFVGRYSQRQATIPPHHWGLPTPLQPRQLKFIPLW